MTLLLNILAATYLVVTVQIYREERSRTKDYLPTYHMEYNRINVGRCKTPGIGNLCACSNKTAYATLNEFHSNCAHFFL